MTRTLTTACALLAGLLCAAGAASAKGTDAGDKPHAPPEAAIIAHGNEVYLLKDYEKALDLYREAAAQNPKKPQAHYFIGCAQRALKRYDEAVESFKTAYLLSVDDEWAKGIASYNIALTYEAAGRLDEAAGAWDDFIKFAGAKKKLAALVEDARERAKAIDRVAALEKAYVAVRERIAKGSAQ